MSSLDLRPRFSNLLGSLEWTGYCRIAVIPITDSREVIVISSFNGFHEVCTRRGMSAKKKKIMGIVRIKYES